MTEAGRREVIEAALQAGTDETMRLQWRESTAVFPVVRLPLDVVLLNPRSHRIRAQLESNEVARIVRSDPYSAEAQQLIAQLLRATPGFADLKINLGEEGQREHGVVTRSGLLVNANTRAVALQDLGKSYITAAVLPADVGEREVLDVELSLQMARDFRQEYTYTNELLFVEELLTEHGYSVERVARALGWAPSSGSKELDRGRAKVNAAVGQLSLIRELQRISGGRIPLTFFDEKRQSLIELERDIQGAKDPNRVEDLKQARFLGILLELGYRELRHVDADFVGSYVTPAIEDDETLRGIEGVLTPEGPGAAADGLIGTDVLPAANPAEAGPAVGRLVRLVAAGETLPRGGDAAEPGAVLDALRTAVETAAELARGDRKSSDRIRRPLQLLRQVNRNLSLIPDILRKIGDDSAFDRAKYEDELQRTRRHLEALAGDR